MEKKKFSLKSILFILIKCFFQFHRCMPACRLIFSKFAIIAIRLHCALTCGHIIN